MKAIVYHQYGSPELLHLEEVAKPAPKENEVLVRVHAVSINDWDYGLLYGTPFVNRMMNGLFRPRKIPILGSDIAGVVEAVGEKVTRFVPGDQVYGDLNGKWGGLAEYVCAKEDALAKKPEEMSFEEAASLPQVGNLALQALDAAGKIEPGHKVLLNGAGGGVGTLAIQILKSLSAEITVVDSSEKLKALQKLGAHYAIDYRKEDFTQTGPYDLILDVKSNRSMSDYRRALSPDGIYVTVGGETGSLMPMILLGPLVSRVGKKRIKMVMLQTNRDLERLNELYEAKIIRPILDHIFPLEEADQAFHEYEQMHFVGKVVIKIS